MFFLCAIFMENCVNCYGKWAILVWAEETPNNLIQRNMGASERIEQPHVKSV